MGNTLEIKVENIANIEYGEITIDKNLLNLKYGMNGIGKTSIIKAIVAEVNNDRKLKAELVPFGTNKTPSIKGLDSIKKVKVFNEDYVSQFLYKENDLIENSFDVVIRDSEYDSRVDNINELFNNVKEKFTSNKDLITLTRDIETFVNGIKINKDNSVAKNSVAHKAFVQGNVFYNIPKEVEVFEKVIKNLQWIDWHNKGDTYFKILDLCPYCGNQTGELILERNKFIKDKYNKSNSKALISTIDTLEGLKKILSKKAAIQVEKILASSSELSEESWNYLKLLRNQANNFLNKLNKIKEIGFLSFRDADKKDFLTLLSKYKIDIGFYELLDNEFSNELVTNINKSIDDLIEDIGLLIGAITMHNDRLISRISKCKKEMNEFLNYAGFNYYIEIVEDKENYTMSIFPNNCNNEVKNVTRHLSFGEKNTFSLVLFFYDVINDNPDLIILDDPVSSFDKNKKFALMYKLFNGTNSLQNKTVLMLTHSFKPILDMVYIKSDLFDKNATYIKNKKGVVSEMAISKKDIESFVSTMKHNVKNSNNILTKLIHLRRYYEVQKNDTPESILIWNYLSSLLHIREIPTIKDQETGELKAMDKYCIEIVEEILGEFIEDLDYQSIFDKMNNDFLLESYCETTSNYEKLQLFRIIAEENKIENETVIQKFVNQTYHPEGDYLYDLNPLVYEIIPDYIIEFCDKQLIDHSLIQ